MRASSRPYIAFGALFLTFASLLHRPLVRTLALALRSDEYTHILLILPVSAVLISTEWNSLKVKRAWSFRAGSALAAIGFLIAMASRFWFISSPDVQLFAAVLSLLTLWIAAFVFCFGIEIALSMLFSLCFLFWMAPLPARPMAKLVEWLQQGSSFATWLLFSVTSVPVIRDGNQLTIPGLTIEVAQECSSIRSSLMLVVTTMVLAHLLLRAPWRRLLVVLVAIPLSVAKNGLRIFTIAILGTRVDRSFLSGHLHHDGGVIFLLIALAAIGLIIGVLRRGEAAVLPVASLGPAPS